MVLNLALSYGSRDEIIFAVKKMISDNREGKLDIDDIDKDTLDVIYIQAIFLIPIC